LSYIAYAAAAVVVVFVGLHVFWRAVGYYRVRKAGPRPLFGVRHRLWRDPGAVPRLDLHSGPGGSEQAPVAPFRFIEEQGAGTQPCVVNENASGPDEIGRPPPVLANSPAQSLQVPSGTKPGSAGLSTSVETCAPLAVTFGVASKVPLASASGESASSTPSTRAHVGPL